MFRCYSLLVTRFVCFSFFLFISNKWTNSYSIYSPLNRPLSLSWCLFRVSFRFVSFVCSFVVAVVVVVISVLCFTDWVRWKFYQWVYFCFIWRLTSNWHWPQWICHCFTWFQCAHRSQRERQSKNEFFFFFSILWHQKRMGLVIDR